MKKPVRIPNVVRQVFALLIGIFLAGFLTVQAKPVNIAAGVPSVEFHFNGKTYHIERIQDNSHRLENSFAETSRPCPPFCIHPMNAAPGVETVGELEVIKFLKAKLETGEGLLIDARIPAFYTKGTIPGALNIPFTLFSPNNPYVSKLLLILGASKDASGRYNFRNAKELVLFCNGPWCDQSPRAIRNLIAVGYPPSKLHYYRGGMQAWLSFGLTVVVPEGS